MGLSFNRLLQSLWEMYAELTEGYREPMEVWRIAREVERRVRQYGWTEFEVVVFTPTQVDYLKRRQIEAGVVRKLKTRLTGLKPTFRWQATMAFGGKMKVWIIPKVQKGGMVSELWTGVASSSRIDEPVVDVDNTHSRMGWL